MYFDELSRSHLWIILQVLTISFILDFVFFFSPPKSKDLLLSFFSSLLLKKPLDVSRLLMGHLSRLVQPLVMSLSFELPGLLTATASIVLQTDAKLY